MALGNCEYGFSSMEGGSAAPMPVYDIDAIAYFTAVESTGTTISSATKLLYNNFYLTAKAAGYYSQLTCVYAGRFNNAAANAINLINPTISGIFFGGWTHTTDAAPVANGVNAYFDTATTPDDAGTLNRSLIFGVSGSNNGAYQGGVYTAGGTRSRDFLGLNNSLSGTTFYGVSDYFNAVDIASYTGVQHIINRQDGTVNRYVDGTLVNSQASVSYVVTANLNIYLASLNLNGVNFSYANGQYKYFALANSNGLSVTLFGAIFSTLNF